MKGKKSKLPLVILFIGVLIISFTFYFYQIFFSANFQVGEDESVTIEINSGMSFKELRDMLKEKQIVNDVLSFAFVSKLMKYQDHVKSGRYLIEANSSNFDVIKTLRAGLQKPVKVTFNNVRTKKDLAEKVSKYLEMDTEQLYLALRDPELCAQFEKDTFTVVNLFIPNTYEMYWQSGPEEVIGRMKNEYDKFWTDERIEKARQIGLNRDEVSVLASIVQAETRFNDEKPRIAGVYLNRLRNGIPLQADPTLVFAHGDFEIRRVLKAHKEIDSPYNTYRNTGLPPGPINIPSMTSIDAVLNAEKHDYYFFCAKEDFSGYHNFAKTIREHINNANRYQRALNRANIR